MSPTPSMRRMAIPAAVLLAVGLSTWAPTASAEVTAAECVEAGNVWVHVEIEDEYTGGCATEFATGTEAMVSSGLAEDQGNWVLTIADVTAEDPEWWSLWTSVPEGDGVFSEWEFSQVGIADLEPEAGSVIGWRLLPDWNLEAEAPTVNPVVELDEGPEGETPLEETDDDTTATPEPEDDSEPAPGLPSTGN